MSPKVSAVKYIDGYKLQLTFTNNEERQFDLVSYLEYPVYEPLKDESFCRRVYVKNGIVQWNGEIDFDPDRLYLESIPVI